MLRNTRVLPLVAFALAAQPAHVLAQTFSLSVLLPAGDQLGACVASIDDLNGDGVPDLILGAPQPALGKPGYVRIVSGKDGSLLKEIQGATVGDDFGVSAAAIGDIDHDGKCDFAVGAYDWRKALDGIHTAYVRVYSGGTWTLLHDLHAPQGSERYGHRVSGLADVDQDGYPDFMIAEPSKHSTTHSARGKVHVHSGKTGALLYSVEGAPNDRDEFGDSLCSIGDLNHDGCPDFLVGAPGDSKLGESFRGCVFAYSGRDGALLFRLDGPAGARNFGGCVLGIADLNGDQVPDLIVGSGESGGEGVGVFSGSDRTVLRTIAVQPGVFHPGRSVAVVGDRNGDGQVDIAVGDPGDLAEKSACTRVPTAAPCFKKSSRRNPCRVSERACAPQAISTVMARSIS
jgi:hypothetical protein